jgi:outer membrane receptor protein involved in Fe transport
MITSSLNARKSLAAIAVGTALMLSAPSVMAADAFNGVLKGTISTVNNQAAPNATVTIKHKGKGITRTTTTLADGSFSLPKLPVGEYTVTISKDGYEMEQHTVQVNIGSAISFNGQLVAEGSDVERIQVTGSNISRVDLASSTGGIVITAEDIQNMPIESGFDSIAMLSPGATAANGDNFNGSPSIGGSSSAENGYYLNGLNVTSVKTGLGSISLPWEAISQTEVMTGGVNPEFGNALGGIVNAVSKSGDNEFNFGAQVRVDPEALRSHHNDLYQANGDVRSVSANDESTFTRYSIWGSGALIEDTLFAYVLLEPQKNDYDNYKTDAFNDGKETSDRWFAKLDWYITDDHSIELTAINFESEGSYKSYDYDYENNIVDPASAQDQRTGSGGDVFGIKYSGIITDNLSIEVVAGRVREEESHFVSDELPWVGSYLFGGYKQLSNHTNSTVTTVDEVTRDQLRADIVWELEDHSLKFGFDYYDTYVDYESTQNGAGGQAGAQGWWYIKTSTGDGDFSNLPAGTGYVDQRIRSDFAKSHVISTSFYIQDSWQATDNLVLNMGLRYNDFSNEMSDGKEYVSVSGQIAPRLQAIYDLAGDGSSKVFMTYGRYFQPVSPNMNITQGGSRRDEHWYYELDQVDADGHPIILADGSPSRGAQTGYNLPQSGESTPAEIVTADLDPMYTDEITIGYQTEVFDGDMSFGVKAIYKDLGNSIEDADFYAPINNWYVENGYANPNIGGAWILFNPGSDLDVMGDFDHDGTTEHIQISAKDLAMPEASRQYGAMEFTLDGMATEKLFISASYTWSHLWGNTAGLVNDDDNQADPGWTVSYDYAGLQDNASGNLPSDRRHTMKLFGSYAVTEDFTVGLNANIGSGKPVSAMGIHPENVGACATAAWASCPSRNERGHDASFYDENGDNASRGTYGTTDWTYVFDLSATYRLDVFENDLMFKATVYNLFNSSTQTTVDQGRTKTDSDTGNTVMDSNFGMTTGRVSARYVSLTARYEF